MRAIDTYTLLRALCQELERCGVQHACTSPGSRCTPLVLSLVRQPGIRCWSHIDERCAGFFALGAAKASGRPVAVTCTSGTAAVNLAPAVVEASWARVPLIVLTADRPAELRDVGAGQAIDQLKLYGDTVKWFCEVELDEATPARLRWARTLACRAYWTALEGRPGPVHLNFPLREPLVTDAALPEDGTARAGGRPYVMREPLQAPAPARGPGPRPSGRLLVVAGEGTPDPAAVAGVTARAGIPLLADPLSGARRGPSAIAHYDLLLRDPAFARCHRPQFVLRLGALPTSKPLRAWLAGLDAAQIAFDPDAGWQDPDAVVGLRLRGGLPRPEGLSAEPGWLHSWKAGDAAAAGAIDDALGGELSEPAAARALGRLLTREQTLFVASSMPIRDVETFFPVRDDPPPVLANRGASGIDGTVSSAFGAAAAGRRVVLLIGDVALIHDAGGLLAASRLGLELTIVVLNNDGGGIFHFLPVAGQREAFREHVATPHGLDFHRLAALYGAAHELVRGVEELTSALRAGAGTRILEVRTDREENLGLHRRVADAVAARLAALRAPGPYAGR